MKLKSTLWALALAFAAVSCSDDLDSPNGNENSDGNKSSTYMKVTVNAGVVTRAGESTVPPTGGEEGDGNEVGDVNEYIVRNVTVILYKNMLENRNNTENDSEFKQSSEIVGVGFATTSGAMGTEDNEELHSRSATVLVTATDEEDFNGNTYGIIAVTNWPNDTELKDKIQKDKLNATEIANLLVDKTHNETDINRFVMSSHKKAGETVILRANATAESAPNANVHVERLAAKVRIKPTTKEGVTNYIYPIKKDGEEIAKVRLDRVALVNKLKTGSYLLKRVTPSSDATATSIPSLENDSWQGDEEAVAGTVYPGSNYVIDPWTRNKILTNNKVVSNINAEDQTYGKPTMMTTGQQIPQLDYDNKYTGSTFTDLWTTTLEGKAKQLSAPTENVDPILIDYTMENTTSAVASKNGYSTGALFKAVYLPKYWSEYGYDAATKQHYVKPIEIDYNDKESGMGYNDISQSTTGQTFYTYQRNVYKNIEAIFNEFVLGKQEEANDGSEKNEIYLYKNFLSTDIEKINVLEFANSQFYKATATDPIGYISYLRSRIKTIKEENNDQIPTDKTFNGETDGIDIYQNTHQDEVKANVTEYTNGITYYPYWIRHANNGKPTEMGIMEFGIVRNNIYDMIVSDINALGLSGTEMPDPDKNDETKEYLFNVKIYVKDWVIRDNNNITLQ